MNKVVLIAMLAIFGIGGLFVISQNRSHNDTLGTSTAISIQTVKNDVSNGGQLIDVRTPTEYASGHIDGAVNLPLQDIQLGIMPEVPKDKPVYLYCRSGNRSSQAATALKALGYQNIIDLGAMTSVQSIGGVIKS